MIHELSNKCLFRPNLLFNIFLSKLQTLCCNGLSKVFCQMSGNDNYLFPSSGLSIDHMIFFSVILIFDFHFHLRSQ